jgi:hypothetical protein
MNARYEILIGFIQRMGSGVCPKEEVFPPRER